jgi:hypothetical protein
MYLPSVNIDEQRSIFPKMRGKGRFIYLKCVGVHLSENGVPIFTKMRGVSLFPNERRDPFFRKWELPFSSN